MASAAQPGEIGAPPKVPEGGFPLYESNDPPLKVT